MLPSRIHGRHPYDKMRARRRFALNSAVGMILFVGAMLISTESAAQEPDVNPVVLLATVEARMNASNAASAQTSAGAVKEAIGNKLNERAFHYSSEVIVQPSPPVLEEPQSQNQPSAEDTSARPDLIPAASAAAAGIDSSTSSSSVRDTISSFSKGEIEPQGTSQQQAQVASKIQQIIEMPLDAAEMDASELSLRHNSVLDVITMAVALVMALLVVPLAMAYRVSSSFRNAILALSSKPKGKGKRLYDEKDSDYEKSDGSGGSDGSASGAAYQPKLLSLQPTSSTFRSILSPQDVQRLVPHLPYHLSAKDWQLLYANELHGYSLHAAYRRASAMGPCVVAVMDMNQSVFAAFCSESLKPNGINYFGNGECWVATVSPHFNVYKWTPGNNEQFVLATDSFIGFGGGGTFALWLDAQFDRGTSEPNSTFGNATFLASAEAFKVASLEIWGFASPSLRTSLGTKAFKTVTSVMGRIASKASTSFGPSGSGLGLSSGGMTLKSTSNLD